MAYHVYILASRRYGTLYIGVTNDLARRIEEHRLGRGSRFVKQHGINRLVHAELFANVEGTIRREKQLKKRKRDWKIQLIETGNLEWRDLSDLVAST